VLLSDKDDTMVTLLLERWYDEDKDNAYLTVH
jgi:hypothetical protein